MLEEVGAKLIAAGEQAFLAAMGKAKKSIDDTGTAAKQAESPFTRLTSGSVALGTAMGQALYNGAMAAGRAILNTGKEALSAYGFYERMGLSLDALVARELKYGSAVDKTTTSKRQASAAEKARAKELQEMIDKETKAASKVDYMSDAYLKSEKAINKYKAEMQALGITQDGYIYSTKTATSYTLSMADALEQAGPRAQELLDWINQLAIISPFQAEDVAQAFRTAMAYGFTSKEAQRLVTTFTDFTAATGATGDVMDRIMLSLGQIRSNGKLSAREVRELALAGVPVKEILGRAFKLTGEQLENLAEDGPPAADAIEVLVKALEEDFGGAAKRQAGTWQGLLSSLSDIKRIGLKEFFTSTFKIIQPYLQKFVDLVQTPAFMTSLRQWGEGLGNVVKKLIGLGETIGTVVGMIRRGGGASDIVQILFGVGWSMKFDEFVKKASEVFEAIKANVGPFVESVIDFITGMVNIIQPRVQKFLETIQKWWSDHGKDVWAVVETIWTKVRQIIEVAFGLIKTVTTVALIELEKFWSNNGATIMLIIQTAWDLIYGVIRTALDLIRGIITLAQDLIEGDWQQFGRDFQIIIGILWDDIKSTVETVWNDIRDKVNGILAGIVAGVIQAYNDVVNWVNKILAALGSVNNVSIITYNPYTGTSSSTVNTTNPPPGYDANGNYIGFQSGGFYPGKEPIVVGEKGPELFFPNMAGYVMPNDLVRAIMGAQAAPSTVYNNTTINYNLGVTTSQSPQVVSRSFAQMQLLAG